MSHVPCNVLMKEMVCLCEMVYLFLSENQSLVWETLSNESFDKNVIVSCQDKSMLSYGNKVEMLSLFLISGPYPPLPKKVHKCPLILAGITPVRKQSSPCGFTYIWIIEDSVEIMLFNVINAPLLKGEKNTLGNERRDVECLIRTMEKPTARCLGGRSWGSGGQSSALGHETVLVPTTLSHPCVFLSYLLSS